MLKNYITIAFRNFWRNRIFSFINISGLAIGISASLVIYLIINYEFSFEKFRGDHAHIYRVVTNMHFPDQDFKNAGSPGPLAEAVRNEIPGIDKSTSFWLGSGIKVKIPVKGDKGIVRKQDNIIYADDQYFKMFHYEWIAGAAQNALAEKNAVVLTESRVRNYFNFPDIKNAIGQTIIYNDSIPVTVTGIVKDLSGVTDFDFKEFISFSVITDQLKRNNGFGEWGSVSSSSQFFIKLKDGIDPKKINVALAAVRKKHEKNAYLATDHFLQPLDDIHFNNDFDAFDHRQAHKPTLYGLMAVAAFLLLLGCINFINLTTAQASQRAKEIGIRKTMGSSRRQLVTQFMIETCLLTLSATFLSIILIPWLLKIFSPYVPAGLHFAFTGQPQLIVFILGLVVAVSILSGFYPALILSGYKPVSVLKNIATANSSQSRRVWIRKTLTVSQFVIAQFFIFATIMVSRQISYSLNKDLGFKKDAIINFSVPFDYQHPDKKQFVLQEKLKQVPGIQGMSLAGTPPANDGINISTMKFNDGKKDIEASVEVKQADTAYFGLYKIKLLAGRNLGQSDTVKEYIINENYCRLLGFKNPADAVGHFIERDDKKIPIVGVMADINTRSLHSAVQPLVYTSEALEHTTFHIALPPKDPNTDNWATTINAIGKKWKEVYPEENFGYTFFDQTIANFYKKEKDTAALLNWSTGLAIFISCLGLLGLVIYTTSQRIKEIGIRKVLGASVSQIVSLLSKDFMKLVLLAFIIAAPLAWWGMHKWLEDFAFKTQVSWWIFVLGGMFMLVVALLTLSVQTIRAALANPVKNLRTE